MRNIQTFLVQETYFVVSKIITLQEFVQPRKKLVVVEGINGFHVTGAIVYMTSNLLDMKKIKEEQVGQCCLRQ